MIRFILTNLVFIIMSGWAEAATLRVRVVDIQEPTGQIMIVLCQGRLCHDHIDATEQDKVKNNIPRPLVASRPASEAKNGSIEVVVTDLPPGEYSVFGGHDQNGNSEIDMVKQLALLGGMMPQIPEEPFILSGARNHVPLSSPSFEESKITLSGHDSKGITLKLLRVGL